MLRVLVFKFVLIIASGAWGQCTAVNIPTLPVTNAAAACHASNQITATNIQGVCGAATTSYLGGNEALHTVTPTITGNYTITYTGQTWTSIWVYSSACPTQAGSICVGSVSSSGSTQSLVVNLTAGVQYWIIFDTFPSPISPCPGTFSISAPLPPGAACGTTVFDQGGAGGNYPNGTTFTQTYCPAIAGTAVTLNFSQFATEGCCDFLTIYNGNSTAAPVIGTYSGTTSPGVISSTAADGCITIRFTSDGSVNAAGWAAAVTCAAAPPPPNFCGTTVYDPGGVGGNYANGTTFTQTYCPAIAGTAVTLNFSQFATEGCCDFLTIYNGNSTAAPVIGTYSGTTSPGVISSTAANGCITIRFTSDGSVNAAGWAAAVICAAAPPPTNFCGTTVYDPGGVGGNYPNGTIFTQTYCPAIAGTVVTLNFSQFATEGCCDFLTIYNGNSTAAPVIGTYSGTTSPGVISSTAANGCITIRFTSDGSVNGTGWAAAVTCGAVPPPPNYCGTSATDPGGTGSDYGNSANFTRTYCPDTPGEAVSLSFLEFGTEGCCDFLSIYNGSSTAAPLIGTYSGTNSPGVVTSTAPDGCITIRFTSDGSVTGLGWNAIVSCGEAADCVYLLTLRDSFGDGWGSSNVGVSINGGPVQFYSVSGSQNVIPIVANAGDVVVLTYGNTGPDQGENSFTVGLLGGGVVYASSTPPSAGFQPPLLLDCIPPPSPPQDCIGGVTICSGQAFNNNSNNTGNVVDLNLSNQGCLSSGERQGTWYYFSPSSGGTIGFTISPSAVIDYDFALWGPLTAPTCPPVGPPLRCSYSAQTGPTGLGGGAADLTEGVGGDRWVSPINVLEGQVYVLYIDNFSSTGQAFDLSWQLSSGASLDCTVLPIDITQLGADPYADHVAVSWNAFRSPFEGFYRVERSADGEVFQTIGTVGCDGGGGTSSEYKYFDIDPIRGWNHYRLVLVVPGEQDEISNVVSALWGRGLAPAVVPNPATEVARIIVRDPLPWGSVIQITDAAGQLVEQQFVASESTQLDLDIRRLVAGSYIVLLQGPQGAPLGSTRFVKL